MNPETFPKQELIGRSVTVIDAPNDDLVGLSGTILQETTQTFVIRRDSIDRPTARIPKQGTTFLFDLDDAGTIRIQGERLLANPVRRSETGGDSAWV